MMWFINYNRFLFPVYPHACAVWSISVYGRVFITWNADCEPDPNLVHAPEVPARLHVPKTCPHHQSASIYLYTGPLSHHPLDHQEHQENIHRLSHHGMSSLSGRHLFITFIMSFNFEAI